MKKIFEKIKLFFTKLMLEEEPERDLSFKQQVLMYSLNDIYHQHLNVIDNEIMINKISYCLNQISEDSYLQKCSQIKETLAKVQQRYMSDLKLIYQA